MSRIPPLQSTNSQLQATQVSKNQLSNTDRKVSDSPILRHIIMSLATSVTLGVIVVSCIVTPALLFAVVPAVFIVAYRIFAPSQPLSLPPPPQPLPLLNLGNPLEIFNQPAPVADPSFAGSFTGLNRRYNECFINSAIQFLEGSPLYADIISNNPQFTVLKNTHDGIRASIRNHQLVADVDTHDVRMWLYESVKGKRNQISSDGQEDTSVLLEELFSAAYPELPFKTVGFRASQRANERVFSPPSNDKMQWINLPIDSPNFMENFNAFFWDTPERSDSEIREAKTPRNVIRQFTISPEDYFIRLKRFDNVGNKITRDVNIPEVFYHEKDMHTTGQRTGYEVDRFIQHRGSSLHSGHYVTFKKVLWNGQPIYLEFDDTLIREVSKQEYFQQLQQAFWLHVCKI